jgi:hypothetical protein
MIGVLLLLLLLLDVEWELGGGVLFSMLLKVRLLGGSTGGRMLLVLLLQMMLLVHAVERAAGCSAVIACLSATNQFEVLGVEWDLRWGDAGCLWLVCWLTCFLVVLPFKPSKDFTRQLEVLGNKVLARALAVQEAHVWVDKTQNQLISMAQLVIQLVV